ncbi:MAG: DMT family transporter [Dehalococcoidia bacterium]
MPWLLVVVAGLLEVGFAVCLKESSGFTKLWPSVGAAALGGSSFLLLTLALKSLPVGTAYAVWTGLGAAGTVAFGVAFLSEPANVLRLGSVAFVLIGIIGLKLDEHV